MMLSGNGWADAEARRSDAGEVDLTSAFFMRLRLADEEERRPILESICDIVRSWALGGPSGAHAVVQHHIGDSLEHSGSGVSSPRRLSFGSTVGLGDAIDEAAAELRRAELLKAHLPTVLRLSVECPFRDIRKAFKALLAELKAAGVSVPRRRFLGPSRFIPKGKLVPRSDNSTHFVETFLHDGRVSHMIRIMAYHPSFLGDFLETHHFVMRGDGPIPLDWRNYIAIMAASRHKCKYLMSVQENAFRANGGDPQWLLSVANAPAKLQNLIELNALLAHRPWMITKEHLQKLLRGKDSWSLSELVQAIVLLVQFHSLAGFVFGCGVTPELDMEGGYSIGDESREQLNDTQDNISEAGDTWTAEIAAKLKNDRENDDVTEEENRRNFESIETEPSLQFGTGSSSCSEFFRFNSVGSGSTQATPGGSGYSTPTQQQQQQALSLAAQAQTTAGSLAMATLDVSGIGHVDINVSKDPVLRDQDYSWADHGFSLVNRFYPDVGQLLDTEFRGTLDLTYHSIGDVSNIDTSKYRQAVWYYILRIKGIQHDDYNYKLVNDFLARPLKRFIKMATCYPDGITDNDYATFAKGLKHSERVHVILLAIEARKQAELAWALKAVMDYMT
eukprot:Opistho-1_new@99481